jgi:hypothetical protein
MRSHLLTVIYDSFLLAHKSAQKVAAVIWNPQQNQLKDCSLPKGILSAVACILCPTIFSFGLVAIPLQYRSFHNIEHLTNVLEDNEAYP